MSDEAAAPPKPSSLPIVALVIAVISICMPPLIPVAMILAVIALAKTARAPGQVGLALAVGALVASFVAVTSAGVLAAIAIPNYVRFQARAKQAECKTMLKSFYVAQRATLFEEDEFLEVEDLDPPELNRYTYVMGSPVVFEGDGMNSIPTDTQKYPGVDPVGMAAQLPKLIGGVPVGMSGTCPECTFTAACIGQLDNDATLDVWSISTSERTGPQGPIAAGELFHEVDDLQ